MIPQRLPLGLWGAGRRRGPVFRCDMEYVRRYPKVPWLYDTRDLMPQGDPDTTVFLPNDEHLEGLWIKGIKGQEIMLGVRADAQDRPISCAITREIGMEFPIVQSNPRRVDDRD